MPDEPMPGTQPACTPGSGPGGARPLLLAALAGAAAVGVAVAATGLPGADGSGGLGPLAVLLLAYLALAGVVVRHLLLAGRPTEAPAHRAEAPAAPVAQPRPGGDLLAAMLTASPDAFIATDSAGLVTHWNPAAERMFGWSGAEATGRELAELIIPAELRASHREGIARFAATGERALPSSAMELPAVHRDGHRLTVEMALGTLAVEGGWWCHAFVRDISHRREHQRTLEHLNTVLRSAEAEARQQSALMSAVMNSISDGVVVIDENGDPLLHNEAAKAVLDPDDTCDDPAQWLSSYRILRPDRSRFPMRETPLARALAGESTDDVEVLLQRPDQEHGTVLSVSGRPLGAGAGLHGAVAVFSDITDRKRSQGQLEQAETRWRLTLDHAPTGIVLATLDGRFLHTNEALRRILGYGEADLRTRTWRDITHPQDLAGELVLAKRLLAGEIDDYALEKRYLHAAGYVVWVDSSVAMVRDENGEALHIVMHLQDITRQRYVEEQLRSQAAVFDVIHDAVLINDADGTLVDCNPAMAAMTGYPQEVLLLGRADASLDLGDPAAQEARRRAAQEHLVAHPSWHGDVPFLHADGSTHIAECVTVAVRDHTGRLDRTISVLRDATAAREAAEELRQAEERFRHAFDRSPVGMVLTDLTPGDEGRILRVNDAYCSLLGRSAADLLTMREQDLTHPEDVENDRAAVERLTQGEDSSATYEKRYRHAAGHVVWVEVNTAMVARADGTPHYAVTQADDITARRAESERLAALALRDPLTGLGNRVLLEDRLKLAVHRASRSMRPLAVLFCDLNGFKPINDTYGHAAGDELLKVVGGRIRESVRPADTVCRLGGDEFVILCEDLDAPSVAEAIAERIRATVGVPHTIASGEEVRVGVSIGIGISDRCTVDPAEILARADAHMYEVKAISKVAGRR
ncbi:PAS domain S-box-containing protein/diguanylate cyclase (GGDEF)-like protein [Kineococcus xinjiangensis]|uniref:PAS domain S-box-containing protein/diguanylate cyclase (GGDEF)-like protein n=1 Tax=Kineococcus xinjiangensis TaxID=512762 RepID=A0A2S6IUK1_9ACTN|nr:PAS domain S-box protein [Kineococcus xinjiangensis]PPK97950.1 PAS domain S-box-containing protein/diguanylate cyclase (GGDEF)-like protein [Kineococcus xinjiangensis]